MVNNIICGDCLDIMRDMPDDSVDLVLTDPPYGIGEDGGKHIEWKSRPNSIGKSPKYKKQNWDTAIPSREVFNELFRLSENQIIFGGNYFTEYLKPSGRWIVWDKMIEIKMFTGCQLAWTSFEGNIIKRFQCHPFVDLRGGKDKIHPTQKPLRLLLWILERYSKPTDLIFGPFCGSGTTCVAAKRLGRNYIGIDISEEYCQIARDRLAAESQGLTVKEMKKGQSSLFPSPHVA